MKLYSSHNKLIYNLNGYENLDELFDILFSKCDSFSLEEYKRLNEKQIARVLAMPGYKPLKESLIKIENRHANGKPCNTVFYFAINKLTKKWLLKHRSLICFSGDSMEIIKASPGYGVYGEYGGYALTDICFYHGKEAVIIAVKHEDQLFIHDDFVTEFEQWALKKCYENIGHVLRFMDEWNGLKGKVTQIKFVEHFSSEVYPLDIYFRIFDNYALQINKWKEFYKSPSNSELIAKVLVKKLEHVTDEEILSNLFLWFLNYKWDFSKPCLGSEDIMNFIVSLPDELFISLFNKNILRLRKPLSSNLQIGYLDCMLEILKRKGLSDTKSDLRTFLPIVQEWDKCCSYNPYQSSFVLREDYTRYAKKDALASLLVDEMKGKLNEKEDMLSIKSSTRKLIRYSYKKWILKDITYLVPKTFLTVAHKGIIDCMFDLARCYEQGLGVEKDLKQAEYWYLKAKENGHPKAQERLESIAQISGDREM